MSIVHRNPDLAADPVANHQDLAELPVAVPPSGRAPRTRTGTAWLALWTAVAALVVLIVFMLQNTSSVEVTFLWMHGTVPLALALLIAGVGVAILTMAVGAARIGQLRNLARRR